MINTDKFAPKNTREKHVYCDNFAPHTICLRYVQHSAGPAWFLLTLNAVLFVNKAKSKAKSSQLVSQFRLNISQWSTRQLGMEVAQSGADGDKVGLNQWRHPQLG